MPLTKMYYFLSFLVELYNVLERDRQEIKIDSYEEISFVKYPVFMKNENQVLKNSDFCYTWSNDHNQ